MHLIPSLSHVIVSSSCYKFSGNKWRQFVVDIDHYDILRWDVNETSSNVNFLDLSIEP